MNIHEKNQRKRAGEFLREAEDCAHLLMKLPPQELDDRTFLTTLAAVAIILHARTHGQPVAVSTQLMTVSAVALEFIAEREEKRRRLKRKTKRRARKPKLRLVKP